MSYLYPRCDLFVSTYKIGKLGRYKYIPQNLIIVGIINKTSGCGGGFSPENLVVKGLNLFTINLHSVVPFLNLKNKSHDNKHDQYVTCII